MDVKVTIELRAIWFLACEASTGLPLGIIGYDEVANDIKAIIVGDSFRREGIATLLLAAI